MKLSLELWESIFGVGRGAAAAGSERSRGGKVKEAILYPLASAHRPYTTRGDSTQQTGLLPAPQSGSQRPAWSGPAGSLGKNEQVFGSLLPGHEPQPLGSTPMASKYRVQGTTVSQTTGYENI